MARHSNADMDYWQERFHLTHERRRKLLHGFMLEQLKQCPSDEARRILLGISIKEEERMIQQVPITHTQGER